MDNKYTWDFTLLYKSNEVLNNSLKKLNELVYNFSSFKGKLKTKLDILNYFKFDEMFLKELSKLDMYASMKVDQNMADSTNLKFSIIVDNLVNKYYCETAFVLPELCENSDEFLNELKCDNDFVDYSREIEEIIKAKKHTLSSSEEKIMAGMESFSNFSSVFEQLTDSELEFEDATDSFCKSYTLNHSTYALLTKSEDKKLRETAHINMHKAFSKINKTLTQNYINYLKRCDFVAKTYKYNSYFEKALEDEEVNKDVYDTLIKNIHKHLDSYQNYLKTKAEVLNVDDFSIGDIYAPVGDGSEFDIEYEGAVKLVLEALSPLGDDYLNEAKKAFSNRWVDVFATKDKRSGAYSTSCNTENPFMLLNYEKTYSSISTIAHELGHSMHSYYSDKTQPYFKSHYKIFVAEVASTVNEILLAKHLLKTINSIESKRYVVESLLSEFSASVFRQTMFSEFEEYAHGLINREEEISFKELNDFYAKLQKDYFGKNVSMHEFAKFEWSRIPHFYRAFYVYKYATGFVSAVTIANNIEKLGKSYVDNNYIKFLSAGCSADPVSLLKIAGVDITNHDVYDIAFEFYDKLINELK